jgi:hypothetical protein
MSSRHKPHHHAPLAPPHGAAGIDVAHKTPPPPASGVPLFHECPTCGWLSEFADFRDAPHACDSCRHGDVSGVRMFPSERIRRLDGRIRGYHREGETEIVVILVAAFLEAILEDIIDRILVAHGADVGVRKVVLGSQRSITQRIVRIFPALTGQEFEEACAELGFRDFPYRWRDLREARNAFIHDSPFRGQPAALDAAMAATAMDLLDQAYRLFVQVNNRFVAEGYASRGADPHGDPS